MQVLQAGQHKFLVLELDQDLVGNVIKQAGFEFKASETPRFLTLDLSAPDRKAPLLLFDAADPGNLGWFSRCQFYVDGGNGSVLQTPITIANVRDRSGHVVSHSVRLQISKEIPSGFRLPGKQPVTEQLLYSVLYNFLHALMNVGVGVCGTANIKPLAGRGESAAPRA